MQIVQFPHVLHPVSCIVMREAEFAKPKYASWDTDYLKLVVFKEQRFRKKLLNVLLTYLKVLKIENPALQEGAWPQHHINVADTEKPREVGC